MRHLSRIAAVLTLAASLALAAAQTPAAQATPAAGDPNALINQAAFPAGVKIKIACVGDSITYGYGLTAPRGESNAPPAQLQRMLDAASKDRYEVKNFGVNSLTLLSKGDLPYIKNAAYTRAKDYKPDVVIIMLGTNDTKPANWPHKDEFAADYKDMIAQFAKLESKPRISICRPPIVVADGTWGINEPDIELEIPMIDAIAKDTASGVIDIHGATKGHEAAFAKDKVHPTNDGAAIIAAAYFKALVGKDYAGSSTVLVTAPALRTAATNSASATMPAK